MFIFSHTPPLQLSLFSNVYIIFWSHRSYAFTRSPVLTSPTPLLLPLFVSASPLHSVTLHSPTLSVPSTPSLSSISQMHERACYSICLKLSCGAGELTVGAYSRRRDHCCAADCPTRRGTEERRLLLTKTGLVELKSEVGIEHWTPCVLGDSDIHTHIYIYNTKTLLWLSACQFPPPPSLIH